MFGLFKKKSKKEKLQKKHEQLLKEAYELSKTNRKESDKKAYEADLIAKKIEFPHPITKETITIETELDQEWLSVFEKLNWNANLADV